MASFSQATSKPQESFYMLDENLKGSTQEKAKFFIHAVKENDTSWLFDTYNIYGPLVSSEHYKDEKATVLHGSCLYFNKKGKVDSSGDFSDNLQNGSWYYINSKGKAFLQKDFRMGQVIATKDLMIPKEERKNKNKNEEDIEVESDFPGGVRGWSVYLNKNIQYPERAENVHKEGEVIVQFIVDTEGKVNKAEVVQSIEYSLDQEALRIIKESPQWIPASINGKKVKSYKKQPITFIFPIN